MTSGISVLCFTASYAISLAVEIVGLKVRFGWHRAVMLLFAVAGFVAHTWYLGLRAQAVPTAPLASAYDWSLLAAWLLAVIYLAAAFYAPRTAVGLFVLPLCLALIATSQFASREPFAVVETSRFWSLLHAVMILFGTVAVCVGFLAGVMYLIQSYRLKRKVLPTTGFQLPSLEWLERANSRSLAVSALLIAIGFLTGVLLTWTKHAGEANYAVWSDPVVLSLAAMMAWLVGAEIFRLVYPAARQGRKVAYLTVAAFVFLVFTLASMTWLDTVHGPPAQVSHAGPLVAGELAR